MTTQKLHLIDGQRELFIPLEEIIFVKADGNYCDIFLESTTYKSVRIQIGQLWNLIEEKNKNSRLKLERVGRSFILNLQLLTKADPKKGTVTLHTTVGDRELEIAKVAVKELLKYLSSEKRKEVLADYDVKQTLTLPIAELNDEHFVINGHEYVDLGLPSGLLWATEDMGDMSYFAWGETEEKDEFTEDDYDIDERTLSDLTLPYDPWFPTETYTKEFDVARHLWGGPWHCPSLQDFIELRSNCQLIWCSTQDLQKKGILAIGPNGNRIFIAADGYMDGYRCIEENHTACYWTTSASCHHFAHAWCVMFKEATSRFTPSTKEFVHMEDTDNYAMYLGMKIRPVLYAEDIRFTEDPAYKNRKTSKAEWIKWAKQEGNISPAITDFLQNNSDECFFAKIHSASSGKFAERCLDEDWEALNRGYKYYTGLSKKDLDSCYDYFIRTKYIECKEPKDDKEMRMQLFAVYMYYHFRGLKIKPNIARVFSDFYKLGIVYPLL